MSCGEKVAHYSSVVEEPVPEDMGKGVTIRWLISEKDGARSFYMRLFKFEPNTHINAHFHPWEHEIFVLEGSGRVRIGGKTYDISEGYFIYIPPNVEHEYWSGSEGMRVLCMIPARPTAEKLDKPLEC